MQTVMLLHPAATTHRTWRRVSAALADRYRVVTPDLPGHGSAPGPFTLDRAVAEVGRHLDDAPEAVHLCGLSLSATVAVLTCLARPRQVRSLMLSGGVAHPPAALSVQRAVTAALPQAVLARLLRAQLVRALAADDPRERDRVVAGEVADLRSTGRRTYRAALRELARTDLRARLGGITAPTLVLCGARDRLNLPGARDLAAGIPGARLREIPAVGHLWHLERPDLFARTVAGFAGETAA
jgi:3-oxoadipate enol-lactonase